MKLEVETLHIFLFRFILAIAIFLPLLPSTGGFASYDVRFVFVPIALGIIFLFRKVSAILHLNNFADCIVEGRSIK